MGCSLGWGSSKPPPYILPSAGRSFIQFSAFYMTHTLASQWWCCLQIGDGPSQVLVLCFLKWRGVWNLESEGGGANVGMGLYGIYLIRRCIRFVM